LTIKEPYEFVKCVVSDSGEEHSDETGVSLKFKYNGVEYTSDATGNGPIDAVKLAIKKVMNVDTKVLDYTEHALGEGSNAKAAAYIHMMDKTTGKATFGVGVSSNITRASVKALFSALNRLSK